MTDVYLRSGLANRMRVMASCMHLQQLVDVPFQYYWQKSEELNATFEDLFEPIENVQMHDAGDKFKGAGIRFLRFFLMRWYSFIKYDAAFNDEPFLSLLQNDYPTLIHKLRDPSKKILLRICCEFGNSRPFYSYFKPASSIQNQVNAISKQFNEHTWGIHIRRSDNEMSIKKSPLTVFYQKIDKRLEDVPESLFFVSTDDPAVEQEILQKYGNKIITIPDKVFSRNDKKGMQQAVTDLFLLSKTTKIIGSYYSSFSDAAAKIGNIPIEVAQIDLELAQQTW